MKLASGIMYWIGSNVIKRPDKVLKYFKKAVRLDSNNEMAHYELGHCYLAFGDEKRAEEEYKKAIQVYSGCGTAWDNLANAYSRSDRREEGIICNEIGKALPLTRKEKKVENEYVRKIVERKSEIIGCSFIEFDEDNNIISFNSNTK